MQYIPPKNRDTRWPLWCVRYEVTVPYIQTLDVEELEANGLPTSGDRFHDHAMQWEPIRKFLPIHLIAELWENGANVRLCKKQDAVKIYQAVEDHLQAWKRHIENSFNPTKVPEEDLLILDRFATAVYEKAAPFFTNQWVATNFKLVGRSQHSRRAIMDRMNKQEAEKTSRAQKDKESGVLSLQHLDIVMPITAPYDKNAHLQREQVDYSGTEIKPDVEPRRALTSFLRRS